MKRLLLAVLLVALGIAPLVAQEAFNPEHKLELIAKKGTSKVAFVIGGTAETKINWGDGNIESFTPDNSSFPFKKSEHTYAAPLAENGTITIDGQNIIAVKVTTRESAGSIVGFGEINAPKLTLIDFGDFTKGSGLKDSKDGTVNLSKCTNLRTINLRNVPKIILPDELPELSTFSITVSYGNDPSRTLLENKELDFSKSPKLKTINLNAQDNIESINLTGCNNIQKLSMFFMNGKLKNAKGLRNVTKTKNCNDISLHSHNVPLSQLPAKNPNVKYKTYSINYNLQGYTIPSELIQGNTIDLSAMATAYTFEGEAKKTTIKWYSMRDKYLSDPIPETAYTEKDGVYTFNKTLFGEDKDKVTLYATFESEVFDTETLTGLKVKPLQSQNVILQKATIDSKEMTLVSEHKANEQIELAIKGNGTITAEGIKEPITLGDKAKVYTLTNSTVVLKGDITYFDASNAVFKSIDASQMVNLDTLYMSGNSLESIDLSNNNKLKVVELADNPTFKTIVLPSEKNSLEYIEFAGCGDLNKLNLTDYKNLKYLDISYTLIDDIDLSTLTNLEVLNATFCSLSKIDVSKNTKLTYLNIAHNSNIEKLDVTPLTALQYLNASSCKLSELDVTQCTKLKKLLLGFNTSFSRVDFTKLSELEQIDLTGSKISGFDLSNNKKLQEVKLGNTLISNIDVTMLPNLQLLNVAYTNVDKIDVTKNPELQLLNIGKTKVSELNVKNNPKLFDIYVYSNQMDAHTIHRIIEDIHTAPKEDSYGQAFHGLLLIRNQKELDSDKSLKPTNIFIPDAKLAKEKNWRVQNMIPSSDGGYDYKNVEPIDENDAEQIQTNDWYVVVNGNNATLCNAPLKATFRVYDINGMLVDEGIVGRANLTLNLSTYPKGNYIVAIGGRSQVINK